MAMYSQVTSGTRPDGTRNERIELEATTLAKSYHSISFLETYEQRTKRIKDLPSSEINFTESFSNYSISGFYISEFNTWDTWRLIPTSNPIVAPSQVVTNYTDLTVWSGTLDESDVLTGSVFRQICSGSWEFLLDFDYSEKYIDIYEIYTNILEGIHGQNKIIILNANPDYYYFGRVFVESVDDPADGNRVRITLSYNIQPFLYSADSSSLIQYYDESTHESSGIAVQHL